MDLLLQAYEKQKSWHWRTGTGTPCSNELLQDESWDSTTDIGEETLLALKRSSTKRCLRYRVLQYTNNFNRERVVLFPEALCTCTCTKNTVLRLLMAMTCGPVDDVAG